VFWKNGTCSEDLYHLLFNCSTVEAFWNRFAVWWSDLGGENISLTLKDIVIGLLHRTRVNYLIILSKITVPCIRRLSPQYDWQSQFWCPNETIR